MCDLRSLCPQSRYIGCMIINNASTGRAGVLRDLLDTGVHDGTACSRRCPMIEPLVDILTIVPLTEDERAPAPHDVPDASPLTA
ncbi:hypothetical protein SAMN05421508_10830 [Caenispirillum bisanense]|uniref:Uncharacterized protein n=2 Tax=Caenispirillum bisanense TaxID=414052 RepID=A0A286GUG0_9PROT|nr:hypothetical protein SAMN05421508_10830 [Caenispirillum bisanense]